MLLFMQETNREIIDKQLNDSLNAPRSKYKLSETIETMTSSLRKIISNIYFVDPLYENEELLETAKHLEHLVEKAKIDELFPPWLNISYKNPLSGLMNPIAPPLVYPKVGQTDFHVSFNKAHQGMNNVVHGGVLASVLDEAIQKTSQQIGKFCATSEITTVFKKPTPTNVELIIRSKIVDIQENRILITAELLCNEVITAVATATMVPIDIEKIKKSVSDTLKS